MWKILFIFVDIMILILHIKILFFHKICFNTIFLIIFSTIFVEKFSTYSGN
ncbi:hypothetical protein GCWU000323_02077 [Leptotrichia hofstadii F0254]|uniref:Uncharacterized protein n=1 Tax=Leptotrichia hofstadii F0254 TaxID=634994 RepID=C9MZV7_9FUSO|nr:hypothetical protein GCWU000323_02077 [Leptotrichia hofstadii F0254]